MTNALGWGLLRRMTHASQLAVYPSQENPDVYGVAEFSADMVETLETYFDLYKNNGIVRIEVSSHGLWLLNPHSGGRQFLGRARRPGTCGNHA